MAPKVYSRLNYQQPSTSPSYNNMQHLPSHSSCHCRHIGSMMNKTSYNIPYVSTEPLTTEQIHHLPEPIIMIMELTVSTNVGYL